MIEDLYAKIFDSTVVAIGITDQQGKYVMVNPAWCRMMGYSATEAESLHVNDVTPPEDRGSSSMNFARLISGEIPGIRLSRRYLRKDGSCFWADLHVSRVIHDDGATVELVGIFVNIDPQIKAESDLQEMNKKLTGTNQELQRAMEELDVDDFKKVNDNYGHDVGDLALIELAKVLSHEIRTTDFVGRWGGEEFLFIFPETTCEGAMIVIERVREQVENIRIPIPGGELAFTVSIGLSYHMGNDNVYTIVNEADQAMYKAKQAGKNRCLQYQTGCPKT